MSEKAHLPRVTVCSGTRGLSRLWFLLLPTPPQHPATSAHFLCFTPCLTWLGPQPIAVVIS